MDKMITANIENNFLTFIPFTALSNWSVQYHLERKSSYSDKYQLVEIGNFLSRDRTPVDIADDKEYRRITVKIKNGGVYLRDIKKGSEIGTKKQFIASEGQFIISKIDARNGAMGIISSDLSGAIVTNDFPLFNINVNRINPKYFLLNITTDVFLKFVQSCSSGTTNRQRIDIEAFLKQRIPLPSIEEQNKLIEKYNIKIKEAEILKQQAVGFEKKIEEYLVDKLGIEKKRKKENEQINNRLRLIDYKDLDRWDNQISIDITSRFPINILKNCILEIATGTTPPTNRKEYFDGDINFYTPSDLTGEMYLYNSERKLSELAVLDKKARIFNKNTLLFVGIGSTIGKVGVVKNDYAASNQQITGLVFNENIVNIDYLYYFFDYFKEMTTKEKTQATIPILNQEKILNISIPLPPIAIQTEIANHIQKLKDNKKTNTVKAEKIKALAIQEFEEEIFKLYKNENT